MVQDKLTRIAFLVLALFVLGSTVGCEGAARQFTLLLHGDYQVPTPYITPAARGTPHLLMTPFPQGVPPFDQEKCSTPAGDAYLREAQVLYRQFGLLRSTVGKTKRQDLPPTIDEMREIHGHFRSLELPGSCEILAALDYHMQAEVDQTIRALVAFRNLESKEVMTDYFNEASFHQAAVQHLVKGIH